MARSIGTQLVAGLIVLSSATAAPAWNRPGHMVTGAVAYEALKETSPEALAATVTLLRQHPHYLTLFRPPIERLGLSGEEEDLYLFMLAARWADDIRGNEEFDRGEWHFINIPFKPEGQPDSVVPLPPLEVNILTALDENRRILVSPTGPEDPSVALSWLFHLVGDVQQPLHTTMLFTTTWPVGDRGGTRFYVRLFEGSPGLSLHTVWDNLVLESESFSDARDKATELR